jgi:hypothetical protein
VALADSCSALSALALACGHLMKHGPRPSLEMATQTAGQARGAGQHLQGQVLAARAV